LGTLKARSIASPCAPSRTRTEASNRDAKSPSLERARDDIGDRRAR
jgi:hypothetical protein